AVAGEKDDRDVNIRLDQLLLQVETAQAGKLHVEDQAARRVALRMGEKLPRRGEGLDAPSRRADQTAQCLAHRGIIVDDINQRTSVVHRSTVFRFKQRPGEAAGSLAL